MKAFALNVLQGLTVSAITVTAILLWTFNSRLTRIETRLDSLAPGRVTAPAESQPGQSQLTAVQPTKQP